MQMRNAAVLKLSRRNIILGSLALLGGLSKASYAGTITDAGKVSVSVTAPKRIVTIGSAITEIVFALGEKSHVVAIDLTSMGVAGAQGMTNVGYMRALSTEGVLSQAPDLICVSSDSGPPAVLDALRASGVPFALIPHVPTIEGIKVKVGLLGTLLDKAAEAEKLNADIDVAFAKLAEKIATVKQRPKVLFVLSLADNRIMAGGSTTAADTMITLAGGENIATSFEGYKPISAETILETPPDAILMMDNGANSHEPGEVFANTAFVGSPAAKAGALFKMEGSYLLGFGPHTAEAATELAHKLHRDLPL